ncbi:unnamed protein product [Cuscuta campestris]|uniref:Uncharacterized protein n=1 Tax=Cuscuta campestris TaxID=132261 RepID=A0A484ML79_9ASTE|nr:unnamed protein product [Cuscuta campestris]
MSSFPTSRVSDNQTSTRVTQSASGAGVGRSRISPVHILKKTQPIGGVEAHKAIGSPGLGGPSGEGQEHEAVGGGVVRTEATTKQHPPPARISTAANLIPTVAPTSAIRVIIPPAQTTITSAAVTTIPIIAHSLHQDHLWEKEKSTQIYCRFNQPPSPPQLHDRRHPTIGAQPYLSAIVV